MHKLRKVDDSEKRVSPLAGGAAGAAAGAAGGAAVAAAAADDNRELLVPYV